jgi:hypothetical protein
VEAMISPDFDLKFKQIKNIVIVVRFKKNFQDLFIHIHRL